MKLRRVWLRIVLTVLLLATSILTTWIDLPIVQAAGGSAPPIQWTRSFGQQAMIDQVELGKNGEIYVATSTMTKDTGEIHNRLYALTPWGEIKWSRDFGSASHVEKIRIDADGNLYVIDYVYQTSSHIFYAIRPDGTVKWSYNPPYSNMADAVFGADGTVYLSEIGVVRAIGVSQLNAFTPSGQKKWTYAFPGSEISRELLRVAEDGAIYAFSHDSLIVVNPDGTKRWTFNGNATDEYLAQAEVASDGTVVVLGQTTLTALNKDGSIKWTRKDQNDLPLDNNAFIGRDGTVYYTPKENSTIVALNPDGTKKWEANVGNEANLDFYRIGAESHGLLYAWSANSIVALTKDGTRLWGKQLAFGENSYSGAPLVGVDGTMYFEHVGDYSSMGHLALNPSGSVKWWMTLNVDDWFNGVTQVAADGTVFAYVHEKLYAIQGASVAVVLNGKLQEFDQPPVIRNDRTLVPMRKIFEELGCNVTWDQATQTVTAIKGSTRIELKIGATSAKINGVVRPLDVSAQLINNRTMVPVRFVSEALGASVGWEQQTRTIRIDAH